MTLKPDFKSTPFFPPHRRMGTMKMQVRGWKIQVQKMQIQATRNDVENALYNVFAFAASLMKIADLYNAIQL